VRVEAVGVGRRGRLEHANGVRSLFPDFGDGGATREQRGEAKVGAQQCPPLARAAILKQTRGWLLLLRMVPVLSVRNMKTGVIAIIIAEKQKRRH
jgi:hypothetical protein